MIDTRDVQRPAFVVDQQPDNVSCGPVCLHGLYRYYGDLVAVDDLTAGIQMLDQGGTLDVFLANDALRRGYRATIYSYNLKLFDPTWQALPPKELAGKLREQARHKRSRRLQQATRGYIEFLGLGGKLLFRDLEAALLRRHLNAGVPILTGLSATYLYRERREVSETNTEDDVRGEPVGHFVVLTAYDRETREVMIADPYPGNPLAATRHYAVGITRLINAILLGITTYDANLLVIRPRDPRPRDQRPSA